MTPEIARALDRMQRSREFIATRMSEILVRGAGTAATGTRALEVGARVFDLVTGQEATVVGSTRQDVLVPAPDERNG